MARKIIVYHAGYGCDTGCCGHIVEVNGVGKFHFDHPCDEDFRAYAEELVRNEFGEDHVEDLDWDNCKIQEC